MLLLRNGKFVIWKLKSPRFRKGKYEVNSRLKLLCNPANAYSVTVLCHCTCKGDNIKCNRINSEIILRHIYSFLSFESHHRSFMINNIM